MRNKLGYPWRLKDQSWKARKMRKKLAISEHIELGNRTKNVLESLYDMPCDYGLPRRIRQHIDRAIAEVKKFQDIIYEESFSHHPDPPEDRIWDRIAEHVFFDADCRVTRNCRVYRKRQRKRFQKSWFLRPLDFH